MSQSTFKRALPAAALCALTLAAAGPGAATAAAEPADPRLAAVESFGFALGLDPNTPATAAKLAGYDLVVIDGQLAKPSAVARLRGQGALVLAYLSVGTLEPYRPWYDKLKRFRLRDRFDEFDEDYARVNAAGFRRAIAGRIAPRMLRRGFDGLFLDNTDMVELHKRQKPGTRKLVRRLSRLARGGGGLLFSQNGESTIGPLLPFYDGWNREDVSFTYSFKRRRYVPVSPRDTARATAALRRIGEAGLLVTTSDYTAGGDTAAFDSAVAAACGAGAVPFVSDIALKRIPAPPPSCAP